MNATNGEDVAVLRSLVEVIAFDPSLADDPLRLRAALADLVDDERGLDRLGASVRFQVPGLVAAGQSRRAVQVLIDRAGYRPDVAEHLVLAWDAALATGAPAISPSAHRSAEFENLSSAAPPVALPAPGPMSCVVWPDGFVTAVTLTYDGLLMRTAGPAGGEPRGSWHLVATPQAPLSRAAAITLVGPTRAMLTWSDSTGVWDRLLDREPGTADERISPARLLAAPEAGQARYPMTGLCVEDGEIDLLWSADRTVLRLTSTREWGATRHGVISTPCADRERVVLLDSTRVSPASGWLACQTDRGQLAVARWDFAGSDHDGWRSLPQPAGGIEGLAVVSFAAGPSLIVGTGHGSVMVADVNAAYRGNPEWQLLRTSLDGAGIRSLAADSNGDQAWAAVGHGRRVTLIELRRDDDVLAAATIELG